MSDCEYVGTHYSQRSEEVFVPNEFSYSSTVGIKVAVSTQEIVHTAIINKLLK